MKVLDPSVWFLEQESQMKVSKDPNPIWQDVTRDEIHEKKKKKKRVVLFSLPGAFTPTCSHINFPGFEENYDKIRNPNIDEVYCISVNDAFVMNAWAKSQQVENVKVIPDETRKLYTLYGYANWQKPI